MPAWQQNVKQVMDILLSVLALILLILVFRPHGFFGEAYSARLRL